MTGHLLGFALAVLPVMLTPGVSVGLVVQHARGDGGRRAGWAVAGGTACGLLVHATAATVGLAALVAQSAAAFSVLKAVGAAYLVLLGLRALRSAARGTARGPGPEPTRHPWRQAWLANVLNPRAAGVYLTLVPQFLGPGDPVLLTTAALVGVHVAMQTLWLLGWTEATVRAARGLARPRIRRALDALTGTVLVALGARTLGAARGR